jgi:carbamoyl-phosphate synthase large subunit
MKSTGEVMGIGKSFGEAFDKSQRAAGAEIPKAGRALISVKKNDQQAVVEIARYLADNEFELIATSGTAMVLADAGLTIRTVNKVKEGRPHVVDMIKNKEIDLIVNTTEGKQSFKDSYTIRREALQHKVTYFTTLAAARAACAAHSVLGIETVNRLQDLHKQVAI